MLRKIATIAAVCVIGALLFTGSAVAEEKVIKVGALFPLTGPSAVSGQNCLNSVLAAAELINNAHTDFNVPLASGAGLLDGYRIVIVKADHQGKPDVAKSEAERLYNQEGVFAIIGSYNSSATKPASAVAERAKKAFPLRGIQFCSTDGKGLQVFLPSRPHRCHRICGVHRLCHLPQQGKKCRYQDSRTHL